MYPKKAKSVYTLHKTAFMHSKIGDYEHALEICMNAANIEPNNAMCWNNIAMCHTFMGNFYNKKNATFLNYHPGPDELAFERYLIASSQNETMLYEQIQKIKIAATKIFAEINAHPDSYELVLPDILKDYEFMYWENILDFTRNYFQIQIPVKNLARPVHTSHRTQKPSIVSNDIQTAILRELEYVKKVNMHIANEFIKLLHVYREKKVNASHLDINQMYHPQRLYLYLRTHHWKEGIDPLFFSWLAQMKLTSYQLTQKDRKDLATICHTFGIDLKECLPCKEEKAVSSAPLITPKNNVASSTQSQANKGNHAIPPAKDFEKYKAYVFKRLQQIEELLATK